MLHYTTAGSGPVVVALHGLLGSGDNWGAFSRFFRTQYTVITPDLINHGRSPHRERMTHTSMAEDVAQLLTSIHVNNAVVLGHSLGGKVALRLAQQYPDRVDALILVDIAPRRYENDNHRAVYAAMEAVEAQSPPSRRHADIVLQKYLSDKQMRASLLKYYDPPQWRCNYRALHNNIDALSDWDGDARRYERPALCIYGTQSLYVQPADHERITDIIPQARMVALPTGHLVHIEAPHAFLEIVGEFLCSL